MNARAFMFLVVGVLLMGASIGGAFVGGLLLGDSRAEDAAQSGLNGGPASTLGEVASTQGDGETLADLRARLQSGELTQEELAEIRAQFGGQAGQNPAGGFGGGNFNRGGFAGRTGGGGRGLVGTIEFVDGNQVTVNTEQGLLEATITSETSIQMFADVKIDEIPEGSTVTIIGAPGEDGTIEAASIVVLPEGGGGFGGGFGGGGFGSSSDDDDTTDGQ